MTVEFGYCNSIFGCIGQTADELALNMKFKGSVTVVSEGAVSVSFCDIALVDTVATFLSVKSFFNKDMAAIVCDSATALSNLKYVTPLDYEGNLFNNFSLIVPPKTFTVPKSGNIKIELSHPDLVMEAVKDIVSISVLSEFNSITAKMNAPARKQIRIKLTQLIHNQISISEIANFISELTLDGDDFIQVLSSNKFKSLRNAVIEHSKGHSLEYVMHKYNVADQFEITYFLKMIQGT